MLNGDQAHEADSEYLPFKKRSNIQIMTLTICYSRVLWAHQSMSDNTQLKWYDQFVAYI